MPYEVEVSVRLGDESGVGGLVFASDGQDKHYGFYPSGGQLRLTHFAGPDVFSWSILADVPVASYRPGEWNHLRIVVEEKWITGYVNGDEVVRVEDVALRGGQVGLCKFRETEASFQGFSLGEPQVHEEDGVLGEALASWLEKPDLENQRLMEADPEASRALLQNKIASMEKQVETLRAWAVKLHHQRVIQAMKSLLDEKADAEIDLFHAGLMIAYLNNEDLDVTAYREEFEAMADEVRATLTEGQSTSGILETLSSYLFQQLGFHGSRSAYYSRQNSYLNAVLEDREGIPITLAVVFIELSRRLGVNDVVGMPLPGHFVVQHRQDAEVTQWIDVYDGGNVLSSEAAEALVMATTGQSMETLDVPPATKRQILVRMLRNLIRIDLDSEDATQALPELDLLLSIAPEESSERLSRALLLYQSNQWEKALEDLEWLLREQPPGVHLDRLEELRQRIETAFARQP